MDRFSVILLHYVITGERISTIDGDLYMRPSLGMQEEIEGELGRDELGTKCHLPPPVPNFIRQCVPSLLASV